MNTFDTKTLKADAAKTLKIITILGTRPEITKLSPIIHLLDQDNYFEHKIIHTGQHYDYQMDEIFFDELQLRKPDYILSVGSGSQAKQTSLMMIKIEEILLKEQPDWVIVFADPNTPLAGALVAAKEHFPLIHIEAGCRSFNKKMPEEINRIICDHCADLLLAPDEKAHHNLLCEGLPEEKIRVVGSTAIEASLRNIVLAREKSRILDQLQLKKNMFVLLTIHRAENTNNIAVLKGLLDAAGKIAEHIYVVFPMHPRTRKILTEYGKYDSISPNIKIIEPLGYLDFLNLLDSSLFVMSDSGGIQEEAAALDTPCLILRNETEWTYLTDAGKNILLSTNPQKISSTILDLLEHREKINAMKNIKLNLDSNVSQRVLDAIHDFSTKKVEAAVNQAFYSPHAKCHPTAEISPSALIGDNVKIWHQAQVREGAIIGENCILAKNVYIDKDVKIGKNCKIQNNCSIYHGTTIEDNVFIGPHVVFTNDKNPRTVNPDGSPKTDADWTVGKIVVKEGASLGAKSVILPGITIGRYAMVGAGSVVTKDIPDFGLAYGNPAKLQGYVDKEGRKVDTT